MKKGTRWADYELRSIPKLIGLVMDENVRQLDKWGVQNRFPSEWMLFLTEEVGELAEAVAEHVYREASLSDVGAEAIQVATLALKIAEMAMEALAKQK